MPKTVETMCKTICKTQCISTAKLCANILPTTTLCVKPTFSHHLFTPTPPPYPQPLTSGFNYTYPLFHQAYYYNYK